VRVPSPDWDEDAGEEAEGMVERGGVVEAEVGAEPVEHAGPGSGRDRV